jgi:hypothetical protein
VGVPSYRVTVTVGALRPGVEPPALLPAAADAAAALTQVEASDVAVVRGEARITVRFLADDDRAASRIGHQVVMRVDELAELTKPRLTRRYGGRWYPLRSA